MTRKCCVPKCMTNRSPICTDDRKRFRRPCFGFPVDEDQCKNWLERIPRDDLFKIKYAGVCILHFESHFVKFVNKKYILSKDAIPTIFESDPFMESETNIDVYPQQMTQNNLQEMIQDVNIHENANNGNLNSETDVTDFDYLRSHLTDKLKLNNWMIALSGQSILIFNINKQSSGVTAGELSIRSTININRDLSMKVIVKGVVVFSLKISKWTQIQTVIDKLQIKTDVDNDMGFQLDSLIVVKNNVDDDIDMKTIIGSSDSHPNQPENGLQQMNDLQPTLSQQDLNCKIKEEPQSVIPDFEGYFFNEDVKPVVNVNVDHCVSNNHLDSIVNNSYTCSECGKEFDHHIRYMLHVRRHDPKHCKVCPICNKSVYGKMNRHLKSHGEKKSYPCDVCSAVYKSSTLLKEHTQSIHCPGEFYCDMCNDGENLKTKARLRRHMQRHVYNVNTSKAPVDFENFQMEWILAKQNERRKVFYQALEAESMEKDSPTTKLSNVCTSCGKAFLLPKQLRNHMRRHDQSRWKECPICKKSFPDGLSRHMNTHMKVKNYVCDICGLTYSQSSNLKTHKETSHFADKEFFCDICKNGFIYRSREHLRVHLKAHLLNTTKVKGGVMKSVPNVDGGIPEKIYSCIQCDATFSSKAKLTVHTLTVHKDEKEFNCLKCDKKFAYRGLLISHAKTHSFDSKFTCKECGKCFKLASYLRKHMHRHKGEENKRRVCVICGKKYVNNVDLRLHLKKIHGIDRKAEELREKCNTIQTMVL